MTAPAGALLPDRAALVEVESRAACTLHRYRLPDGGPAPEEVLVKVRDAGARQRTGTDAGRPTTHPLGSLDPVEGTRLEHLALCAVDASLDRAPDPRLLRVRVLGASAGDRALVVERLPHPPLRALLRGAARTASAEERSRLLTAVRNAGVWLGRYHALDLDPEPGQDGGQHCGPRPAAPSATREGLLDLLRAFAAHLSGSAVGRRGIGAEDRRALDSALDRLAPLLSEALPLVPRHGDLAPRNVLVDDAGRVAGIDPMPRWDLPPHEDVATALQGLRLSAVQVASGGLACSAATLGELEAAFLDGYAEHRALAPADLVAFRLLVLLDSWASAAARDGWRSAATVRAHRAELRRLVAVAAAVEGPAAVGDPADLGLVTVVIPARDEQDAIAACLASISAQDHADLEIIVVDGDSTDATREVVAACAEQDPRIRLIDNPERIVPTGLNRALAAARGPWLVRVDAHAEVPPDYVRRAAAHLATGRWGGVGGRKDGVGRTPAGRAIAAAMASRFGVGGSQYHHATQPKVVDHIPFGAYPTALARELGGWDERLVTNQDYEFDHRVRLAGHELLLDPELVIHWQCRQRVGDLWRQYRRYGRGKAIVLSLHPGSASPRHLIPGGLVVWLLGSALLGLRRPGRAAAAVAPYAAGLVVATAVTARPLDPAARRHVLPAFAAMHIGYGIGFWGGVAQLLRDRGLPPAGGRG